MSKKYKSNKDNDQLTFKYIIGFLLFIMLIRYLDSYIYKGITPLQAVYDGLVVSVDVILLMVIMYQVIDSKEHLKLIQNDHEEAKKAELSVGVYAINDTDAHLEIVNTGLATASNIKIRLENSKYGTIATQILIRNPYHQTGFIRNVRMINVLPNKDLICYCSGIKKKESYVLHIEYEDKTGNNSKTIEFDY